MKRPTFRGFQICNKTEYFYLALLLATVITLFCAWLMRSKTGYSFIAVRENEDSAEAMGMNSTVVKSKALFTSAFLAGVAGGFYGLYNKFIDPDMTLSVHMSVEMIRSEEQTYELKSLMRKSNAVFCLKKKKK